MLNSRPPNVKLFRQSLYPQLLILTGIQIHMYICTDSTRIVLYLHNCHVVVISMSYQGRLVGLPLG